MSARASFPEVGLYLILQNSQGLYLFQSKPPSWELPFFQLKGGESWGDLLNRLKSEWKIAGNAHRLVGIGANRNPIGEGRAFCVFEILGVPQSLPPDFLWREEHQVDSGDVLSRRILKEFILRPSEIWID